MVLINITRKNNLKIRILLKPQYIAVFNNLFFLIQQNIIIMVLITNFILNICYKIYNKYIEGIYDLIVNISIIFNLVSNSNDIYNNENKIKQKEIKNYVEIHEWTILN